MTEPATPASASHVDTQATDVVLRWRDETLGLTAHVMARRLFMTASIDVLLHDRVVLATGGQPRATGTARARFEHLGDWHDIELDWDRVRGDGFPVAVRIDGELVGEAVVPLRDKWKIALIPVSLFGLGVIWSALQAWLR